MCATVSEFRCQFPCRTRFLSLLENREFAANPLAEFILLEDWRVEMKKFPALRES